MNKTKNFSLINGTEEGWQWQIRTSVTRSGSFSEKGKINLSNKYIGYRGTYKRKTFRYKEKLPEGLERHHTEYDDTNPNNHIIYVTRAVHTEIHRGEGGRICQGY